MVVPTAGPQNERPLGYGNRGLVEFCRRRWNSRGYGCSHRVVRLDEREVEVFPAQLAFSAIAIPPGQHRVEWEESFPGWSVSRFGPLLYAAAIGALFAARRRSISTESPLPGGERAG